MALRATAKVEQSPAAAARGVVALPSAAAGAPGGEDAATGAAAKAGAASEAGAAREAKEENAVTTAAERVAKGPAPGGALRRGAEIDTNSSRAGLSPAALASGAAQINMVEQLESTGSSPNNNSSSSRDNDRNTWPDSSSGSRVNDNSSRGGVRSSNSRRRSINSSTGEDYSSSSISGASNCCSPIISSSSNRGGDRSSGSSSGISSSSGSRADSSSCRRGTESISASSSYLAIASGAGRAGGAKTCEKSSGSSSSSSSSQNNNSSSSGELEGGEGVETLFNNGESNRRWAGAAMRDNCSNSSYGDNSSNIVKESSTSTTTFQSCESLEKSAAAAAKSVPVGTQSSPTVAAACAAAHREGAVAVNTSAYSDTSIKASSQTTAAAAASSPAVITATELEGARAATAGSSKIVSSIEEAKRKSVKKKEGRQLQQMPSVASPSAPATVSTHMCGVGGATPKRVFPGTKSSTRGVYASYAAAAAAHREKNVTTVQRASVPPISALAAPPPPPVAVEDGAAACAGSENPAPCGAAADDGVTVEPPNSAALRAAPDAAASRRQREGDTTEAAGPTEAVAPTASRATAIAPAEATTVAAAAAEKQTAEQMMLQELHTSNRDQRGVHTVARVDGGVAPRGAAGEAARTATKGWRDRKTEDTKFAGEKGVAAVAAALEDLNNIATAATATDSAGVPGAQKVIPEDSIVFLQQSQQQHHQSVRKHVVASQSDAILLPPPHCAAATVGEENKEQKDGVAAAGAATAAAIVVPCGCRQPEQERHTTEALIASVASSSPPPAVAAVSAAAVVSEEEETANTPAGLQERGKEAFTHQKARRTPGASSPVEYVHTRTHTAESNKEEGRVDAGTTADDKSVYRNINSTPVATSAARGTDISTGIALSSDKTAKRSPQEEAKVLNGIWDYKETASAVGARELSAAPSATAQAPLPAEARVSPVTAPKVVSAGVAVEEEAAGRVVAVPSTPSETVDYAQGGENGRETVVKSLIQDPSAGGKSEKASCSPTATGGISVKTSLLLQGLARGTGRVVVLRRGAANLADFTNPGATGEALRVGGAASGMKKEEKEQQQFSQHSGGATTDRGTEKNNISHAITESADSDPHACKDVSSSPSAEGHGEGPTSRNAVTEISRGLNVKQKEEHEEETPVAAESREHATAAAPPNKTVKTFEEREREYNELRARIFAVDPSGSSFSSTSHNNGNTSAATSGRSWRRGEGAAGFSFSSPSSAETNKGIHRSVGGAESTGRKSDSRNAGTTPPSLPRIKGLSRYAANDHLDPAFSRSAFPPLAAVNLQHYNRQPSPSRAISPSVDELGDHRRHSNSMNTFPVYEGRAGNAADIRKGAGVDGVVRPAEIAGTETAATSAGTGRKREEEGRYRARHRFYHASSPSTSYPAAKSTSNTWLLESAAAGCTATKNTQEYVQGLFPEALRVHEQNYYSQLQHEQQLWQQQQALIQEQRCQLQSYHQHYHRQQQLLQEQQPNWSCYYGTHRFGYPSAATHAEGYTLSPPVTAAAAVPPVAYDRTVSQQPHRGYVVPWPLSESTTQTSEAQHFQGEPGIPTPEQRNICSSSQDGSTAGKTRPSNAGDAPRTPLSSAVAGNRTDSGRRANTFSGSKEQQRQRNAVTRRTSSAAAPTAENQPAYSRCVRRSSGAAEAHSAYHFAVSPSSSSSTWLTAPCSLCSSPLASAVACSPEVSSQPTRECCVAGMHFGAAHSATSVTDPVFSGNAVAIDPTAPLSVSELYPDNASHLSMYSSTSHYIGERSGGRGGGGERGCRSSSSRGEDAPFNRRRRYGGTPATPTAKPHNYYSSTHKRETDEGMHREGTTSRGEGTRASHDTEIHSSTSSSSSTSQQESMALQTDNNPISNTSQPLSQHDTTPATGVWTHTRVRALRPKSSVGGTSGYGRNRTSSSYMKGINSSSSVGCNGRWQHSGSCATGSTSTSGASAASSHSSNRNSKSTSDTGRRDVHAGETGSSRAGHQLQPHHRRHPSYSRGGSKRNYYGGTRVAAAETPPCGMKQQHMEHSQQSPGQQMQRPSSEWETQMYWQQQGQQSYWEHQQQSYWQQQQQQFYWQQQQQQRQHWGWQQQDWEGQQPLQWQQQEQLQWQQQLHWQQHLQWQQELQWQQHLKQMHAAPPVPPPPSDNAAQQQWQQPRTRGDAVAGNLPILKSSTSNEITTPAEQQHSASAGRTICTTLASEHQALQNDIRSSDNLRPHQQVRQHVEKK